MKGSSATLFYRAKSLDMAILILSGNRGRNREKLVASDQAYQVVFPCRSRDMHSS